MFNKPDLVATYAETVSKFLRIPLTRVKESLIYERSKYTQPYVSDHTPFYDILKLFGAGVKTLDADQSEYSFDLYVDDLKKNYKHLRVLVVYGDTVGIVDNGRVSQRKQIPGLFDFVAFILPRR